MVALLLLVLREARGVDKVEKRLPGLLHAGRDRHGRREPTSSMRCTTPRNVHVRGRMGDNNPRVFGCPRRVVCGQVIMREVIVIQPGYPGCCHIHSVVLVMVMVMLRGVVMVVMG